MSKIIIWGARQTGRRVYQSMKDEHHVVGFVDNDSSLWGDNGGIDGLPVFAPKTLIDVDFDFVVVGTLPGYSDVRRQLFEMGVPDNKILSGYAEVSFNARILFLKRTAEEAYRNNLSGSVAEAGVFSGEFAKEINKYYPDRKIYLFDTFSGFSEKDIVFEEKDSQVDAAYMKDTSEQFVYNKMPNKQMVEIRKGYFPETAEGIDEPFCFVNLDMDLYKPTYEGIKFFYPKLVSGGTLLIHDYFSDVYPNIRQAVEDYKKNYQTQLITMPIGDDLSVAILKP